ncbi:MAG: hypothetical protein ACE5JQ_06755, partial [Candidatus Methylomirabilales bacterium]
TGPRAPQLTRHNLRNTAARTEIEPLYTRPCTPNDNPQIEAFFSTMKGRPDYPGRFDGSAHAQTWCEHFFARITTSTITGAPDTSRRASALPGVVVQVERPSLHQA